MKILLFTDTFYDANGVSRFLQDVAHLAYLHKVKLTIVTSSVKKFGDLELPNVINVKPLLRFRMPFYKDLDVTLPSFWKLSRIFLETNPDIVHISTPGFIGLMGRRLAKKYHKPLVATYHTNFPAYIKKNTNSNLAYHFTLWLMKSFYKPFSLVFSRSDEYKSYLKTRLKLQNSRLKVIPFGIDLSAFYPSLCFDHIFHEVKGFQTAHIKAIYVGRMTEEKNFPFLINVWKKFHQKMEEQGKKSLLICIGEGKYKKEKKALLSHNIHLLDKKLKHKLAPYYSCADFFLFPSTTDTLGQVVMESLACGTTVIVSDKGGPKNIVKNGQNPCGLIKSIDESLWVEAMMDLSIHKEKREMLSKNGYKKMQNHSIKDSFNFFIKAHEEIAGL